MRAVEVRGPTPAPAPASPLPAAVGRPPQIPLASKSTPKGDGGLGLLRNEVPEELDLDAGEGSVVTPKPEGDDRHVILVIDASGEAGRALEKALSATEYEVRSIRTFDEAGPRFRTDHPSLVVLKSMGDVSSTAPRLRRLKADPGRGAVPLALFVKDAPAAKEYGHIGADLVLHGRMDIPTFQERVKAAIEKAF